MSRRDGHSDARSRGRSKSRPLFPNLAEGSVELGVDIEAPQYGRKPARPAATRGGSAPEVSHAGWKKNSQRGRLSTTHLCSSPWEFDRSGCFEHLGRRSHRAPRIPLESRAMAT